MNDLRQSLIFALEKYPERVELAPLDDLVVDSARKNEKRPAYVKLMVPDEVVKALRGPKSKRKDLVALVRIPQNVAERVDSRIILPGE